MNTYKRTIITQYKNYYDSNNLDPIEYSGSFNHLCNQFFTPIQHFADLDHKCPHDRDTAKKKMAAYVCGSIKDGATKSDDSLELVSFLALDNDDQISNIDLSAELKKLNINSLIYPTASNGVIDPTTKKRLNGCRVLIELDYSITPERFREIRPNLETMFPWADVAALKASQFFIGHFTMANQVKKHQTAYRIKGDPLAAKAFPKTGERPRDAKRRNLKNSGVVLHNSNIVEFDDNMVFYGRDGLAYSFDEIISHQMCASMWACPWCEGSGGKPKAHFLIAKNGQHQFFCNHSNKGCGVRGVYRQSSSKVANNIETFNNRLLKLSTRNGKSKKTTIKTDAPFDYSDMSELIINEINGIKAEVTILAGYEGIGKSHYVNHLVNAMNEKVYFASYSNAQAYEQYENFKNHGLNVGLCVSKSRLLVELGVEVVYSDASQSFSGGKINKCRTIKSIMEVLNLSGEEAKEYYSSIKSISVADFDRYDVVCMTHSMLESFSSRQNDYATFKSDDAGEYQRLNDDYIVYYDDPNVDDLFWLSKAKEADIGVYEQRTVGVDIYSVRPNCQRPLINLNNKIVFSTTERLCIEIIKELYNDKQIVIPELFFHNRLRAGDAHLVVSKKVRAKNHKIFPVLKAHFEEETGEAWELIGDGVGSEYNYSTINGANKLKEVNTLIKLSFPHAKYTKVVCAHLPQLSVAEANALIMIDRLNQAVGRNQGYRYCGKKLIAYLEPSHSQVIIDMCRYSFNTINVETELNSTKHDTGVIKLIGSASEINEDLDFIERKQKTLLNGSPSVEKIDLAIAYLEALRISKAA